MIQSDRTYYQCEYCGKLSENYDEIKECETICRSINIYLDKLIEACKELNKLGCSIEVREFPYYQSNKLDLAVSRRLNKDYKLIFKENDNLYLNTETRVIDS